MPGKNAHLKNEKQYVARKDMGMPQERAAKIANSPDASQHGAETRHTDTGRNSRGGSHAQKVKGARKRSKAAHQ